MIFNKYIKEGQVPQEWKDAHVTALHKKESKQILKITVQIASQQYVDQ